MEPFLRTDCWCGFLFSMLKAKQVIPHWSVHVKKEFESATLP